MSEEKIKIEFWKDENGFKPVESFFDNLPKKLIPKILKKQGFLKGFKNVNDLLMYDDIFVPVTGYSKIKPRPYELKIKISSPIRIVCYRKDFYTVVLVEAVKGSFSDDKIIKRAMDVYISRVC